MSVSSAEGKAASVSPVSNAGRSDGVALTPAQIHAAHRSALRQAGRRLRTRSGRGEEPGATARPRAPAPERAGSAAGRA